MLRRLLDRLHPMFEEGGKFHLLHPLFEALDTFLYTPDEVTSRGAHIRDALPEVVWRSVAEMPDAEGTVGPQETEFNADLKPDGTWDVYLFVC